MEKTVQLTSHDGKECRFCKYFDTVKNVEAGQVITLCRRNAPAGVAQAVPQQRQVKDELTGGVRMEVSSAWTYTTAWPMVSANDWCGEFSPEKTRHN